MEKTTLLVIEDEEKIREVIISYFASMGYQIFDAGTAKEGMELFQKHEIQMIILDLMLPDISGEEMCIWIRKQSRVPILMLTAKVSEESLIHGFEIGADDYVKKPFRLKELKARVEALLRRTSTELVPLYQKNSFHNGSAFLEVDITGNTVKKNHVDIKLTKSEWNLLLLFMKYPNKIFTREELIMLALGENFDGFDRSVDSHIRNLRQKVEDNPKKPVFILTVHGTGYRFGGIKDA